MTTATAAPPSTPSCPTSTSAGMPASPTPAPPTTTCAPRATRAATRTCATTCVPCAPRPQHPRHGPSPYHQRRPSARSSAGSPGSPTVWTPRRSSGSRPSRLAARRWTRPSATCAFAVMLCQRHGHQLDDWLARVRTDDLPDLHSFATGLECDHVAVTAGLTLAWRATSTGSRCSSAKCTGARALGCFANASCSPTGEHAELLG